MLFFFHQITLMLLWLVTPISTVTFIFPQPGPPIAKPNCPWHCGNVSIPYPFGIGHGCYLDQWYEIECNYTSHKPFLKNINPTLEVLNISINGYLHVKTNLAFFDEADNKSQGQQLMPSLTGSPFVYSQHNKFISASCGYFAIVRSNPNEKIVGGCMSTCDIGGSWTLHKCLGINCCQTTLPSSFTEISSELRSESGECMNDTKTQLSSYVHFRNVAFLGDQEWLHSNNLSVFEIIQGEERVPVKINWKYFVDYITNNLSDLHLPFPGATDEMDKSIVSLLGLGLIPPAVYSDQTTACELGNILAWLLGIRVEMRCYCLAGFEGNPYLPKGGCRDIDECKEGNPCGALEKFNSTSDNGESSCMNTFGSYMCISGTSHVLCRYLTTQDRNAGALCTETYESHGLLKGSGIGFGTLVLLLAVCCVYKNIKEFKSTKQKNLFFKRNGGLLLRRQLLSGEVNLDKIQLFTSDELKKSTDNFSSNRVIGHGGHGTVYKGMLANGRIVAVKKSKMMDEERVSEFINEVVILSQIKHRNVVRLLGCCLETEVPLLVYEFIPNGTLFQYIHEKNEDLPLTWKMRVRIATEVAGALSYLHLAISCPIYHRDIKSTNILLDEKYRAKIADFGTSRSVVVDQTHLTTLVQGTFGYLDPEYFRSSKFTEKSDVYSFGVVLVELLSGQKPVSSTVNMMNEEQEYQNLAACFISMMQENRLFDIIDAQVLIGASTKDIVTIAELAKRCLNLNGKKRPTMKEVTNVLEGVQISMKNSNNIIT